MYFNYRPLACDCGLTDWSRCSRLQVTPLVGEGGIYDDFEMSSEIEDAVYIEGAPNVPVCLTMSRVSDKNC